MSFKYESEPWGSYAPDWTPLGHYHYLWSYGANRVAGEDYAQPHNFSCEVNDSSHCPSVYTGPVGPISTSTYSWRLPFEARPVPENECVSKLGELLSQSNFNAGVFGGEFKETLKMVSSRTLTFAKAFSAARRGNFPLALKYLGNGKGSIPGASANNWLALKYGWIPLLSDVKAGYDFLTKRFTKSVFVRARVRRRDSSLRLNNLGNARWTVVHDLRCQIVAKVTSNLSVADRLGLTDPATIAWELLPYSFVVDWFIPVGTFLAAISTASSTRGEFWITRYQAQSNLNLECVAGANNPLAFTFRNDPTPQDRWVQMFRVGVSDLPVQLPTLQNPFRGNVDRFLSGMALLRQVAH